MTDFFISYTHKDEGWAEWIAYTLEEAGFTTKIQAWDFRPGSNFVLEMQQAAEQAERTVLVLSPDYLNSKMAAPEWAAAFAKDPQGQDRRIVPVMVRACQPTGLLPTIVQIRIQDLDEDSAKQALLAGVDSKRAKPTARPKFPGATAPHAETTFPGVREPARLARASVIPRLNTKPTDRDIRKFTKDAFAVIRDGFRDRLEQAQNEDDRIDTDFTENTASDFRAELFVDGKSKCDCRIYLGEMFGPNSICYTTGRSSTNSANEVLSPTDQGELALGAMMDMSGFDRKFDSKRMDYDQATEYLWDMFIRPLTYR